MEREAYIYDMVKKNLLRTPHDRGERFHAQLILMNERDGRNAAKSEGIKVKGTIGVLFEH